MATMEAWRRGAAESDVIARAENRAVCDMGDQYRQGGAIAVVQRQEAWGLQHPGWPRAGAIRGHPGMEAGKGGKDGEQNERRVRDAHQRSQPPGRHSEGMEE